MGPQTDKRALCLFKIQIKLKNILMVFFGYRLYLNEIKLKLYNPCPRKITKGSETAALYEEVHWVLQILSCKALPWAHLYVLNHKGSKTNPKTLLFKQRAERSSVHILLGHDSLWDHNCM